MASDGAGEQLITIDPDILGGTPVFAGTRVPLSVLFDNLSDGLTIGEIVDSYPTLPRDLVVKVLENPAQVQRAQAAQAANGIMNLDGPPLTKEIAAVMTRIISGELTTEEAVQMKIAEIKERQRMQVTQEMIDNTHKIDPEKVHFIEGDEIFPLPTYITRPR